MKNKCFPTVTLAIFLLSSFPGCGGGNEDSDSSSGVTLPWAGTQQLGTPNDDTGYGVALDRAGNIYVTGSTGGNLCNTSAGLVDIFLTQFNSSGNISGCRQFGSTGDDIAHAIAIDTSGNIYITGSTKGDLDGNTSAGLLDIFLTKFDSSGNRIFTRQFGTSGDDVAYAIAIDTSGNIYITGSTGGNLGTTSAGGLDIFLTKFDSSGKSIFTRQLGTNQDDIGYGGVVDNSGNIYITGSTGGILGSSSFGQLDVFLAKFNSSWVNQFIVQFGSTQDDIGYSIALSGSDNIYITGSTGGDLPGNTSSGLTDIFLARFNSSGTNQFIHQVGTTGIDIGYSVAVDATGDFYAVGSTEGGLSGNTPFGLSDFFLVKYNSSGVRQFTRQLGTLGIDIAYALAIQANNIYITGSTGGNLDGKTSFGQADIFLVKYDTSGVKK